MIHRLTDPNDPGCFLWSDGAGAAVLEGGNPQGFVGAAFQADGAYVSGWVIAAGGTFEPASVDAVKAGRTPMRREKGNYPATVNEDGWSRLFKASPPKTASRQTTWINCCSPRYLDCDCSRAVRRARGKMCPFRDASAYARPSRPLAGPKVPPAAMTQPDT